jgi:endoglucanase
MKDQTRWPAPKWPGAVDNAGIVWGPERMKEFYAPWKRLIARGVGVHMGETGGSHRCPQRVFLAWLTDVLELCKDLGIGFALWDFIGGSKFGILDTERGDVEYEDWYGHRLDRKMLTLLQKY